jgi:hypothetical protein
MQGSFSQSMKEKDFLDIAFQCRMSCDQIENTYAVLDFFNKEDQIIEVSTLKDIKAELPENFKNWLINCKDSVNIVFKQRKYPIVELYEPYFDW